MDGENSRMMCGSITTLGIAGINLTTIAAITRMSGTGTLTLGASTAATPLASSVATSRTIVSCMPGVASRDRHGTRSIAGGT